MKTSAGFKNQHSIKFHRPPFREARRHKRPPREKKIMRRVTKVQSIAQKSYSHCDPLNYNIAQEIFPESGTDETVGSLQEERIQKCPEKDFSSR